MAIRDGEAIMNFKVASRSKSARAWAVFVLAIGLSTSVTALSQDSTKSVTETANQKVPVVENFNPGVSTPKTQTGSICSAAIVNGQVGNGKSLSLKSNRVCIGKKFPVLRDILILPAEAED